MTEIYMMVGVPASGKSRIVAEEMKDNPLCLSRDKEGGKIIDLLPKMVQAISQGAPTIALDCTFLSQEQRAPFVAEAQKLGVPMHCWFFDTTPEQAQFNACWRMCERYGYVLREEHMKAVADDPNMFLPTVLFALFKKLEKPLATEGFASVKTFKSKKWSLPAKFTNKAVIFDYDDTLRRTKSGAKYPQTPDDVVAFHQAAKKLRALEAEGVILLGASNQSGVAKNAPSMAQAKACFEETNRQLGVGIAYDFDYSPAGPIVSWHRKPLCGMGVDAIWKHNLDPSKVIYVGDQTTDKTFAARCGFQFEWAKDFFGL